ncbi:MAG: response regulator transcription factor [Deltaproteobacteria bacterium]|nr:response regulator transcription factor [Deltaproteobacteria bacterium]
MTTGPVRIVLVDDHTVLRVGLRAFLEEQSDPRIEVLGEAASGEAALELVVRVGPDLVLLDLTLEGMGGLEVTMELRRRGVPVRILVLSQYAEAVYPRRLLEAGANGYVLKSARGEELLAAIRAVIAGGTYLDPTIAGGLLAGRREEPESLSDEERLALLTPRERQVLTLVAEGYANKEIATALDVAVKTVMAHRASLMDKLQIHNRSKLVQFAIRLGVLRLR